jgi:K+-transporting ATPase ATPase C chain
VSRECFPAEKENIMKTNGNLPDTHNPDSFSLTHNQDTDSGGSFLGHLWTSVIATIVLTVIVSGLYPLIVWGVAQAAFPKQANGSLVDKDGKLTSDESKAVGSALLGQAFSLPGYFHPRPSAANNAPATQPGGYSASGGYDPTSSGGTNFGPLSDELINGSTQSPTAPATQPAEFMVYDGIRLRTIHYAVDNNISFKLHHAVYTQDDQKNWNLVIKEEVPLKTFQDAQGNLNDVALIDAFPHPTADSEYTRTVLVAGDFAQPIPADAVTASGSGLDPHITPDNAKIQEGRVAAARNIKPEQVDALVQANTDGPGLGFLGDPGVNVLMLNLALDAKYPLPAAPTTAPAAK